MAYSWCAGIYENERWNKTGAFNLNPMLSKFWLKIAPNAYIGITD